VKEARGRLTHAVFRQFATIRSPNRQLPGGDHEDRCNQSGNMKRRTAYPFSRIPGRRASPGAGRRRRRAKAELASFRMHRQRTSTIHSWRAGPTWTGLDGHSDAQKGIDQALCVAQLFEPPTCRRDQLPAVVPSISGTCEGSCTRIHARTIAFRKVLVGDLAARQAQSSWAVIRGFLRIRSQ